MSTNYVILKKGIKPEFDEDGGIITDDIEEDLDYVKIFHQGNYDCNYVNYKVGVLLSYLPLDTKIYSIDNSPQGIYTLNDIAQYLER